MQVAEIWRFPVKSMAGERLKEAVLGPDGVAGDRLLRVEHPSGRVITARTRPGLLGHRATLGADGEPRVDGRPWRSAEVARDVEAAAGPGSRLVAAAPADRFDVLPLLVATDGAILAFGHDGRRLRPNLVLGGVDGLTEREWEGRTLRVGQAVLRLVSLRQRCVMTTFHPDTLEQDRGVLRRIVTRFGGRLALDTAVLREGRVAEGDPAELLPA